MKNPWQEFSLYADEIITPWLVEQQRKIERAENHVRKKARIFLFAGLALALCGGLQRWGGLENALGFMGSRSFGIYVVAALACGLLALLVRARGATGEREHTDAGVVEKTAGFRSWNYQRTPAETEVVRWKKAPFFSSLGNGMLGRERIGRRTLIRQQFLVSNLITFETPSGTWELFELESGAEGEAESDRESTGSRCTLTFIEGLAGRFRLRESTEGLRWALLNAHAFDSGRSYSKEDAERVFQCDWIEDVEGIALFGKGEGCKTVQDTAWRKGVLDGLKACSGGESASWNLYMDGESLWVSIDLRRLGFGLNYADHPEKLDTLRRILSGFEVLPNRIFPS